MEDQVTRLQELGRLMQDRGLELITALIILIIGLFITKWAIKIIKILMDKVFKNAAVGSIVANSTGVLLLGVVIIASAMNIGVKPGPLVALMMIVVLAAIGIIVIFRPLIPTLPFKVGNTVKAGNLLGKVEATTVLNTRLRTFDGKTFLFPNRQILNDIVINYHFTRTRRVKLDVTIRYDQDLTLAKRVLEALMIEDARILAKPNPQVYVLELGSNGVKIGGRCWVNNIKYWVTKCEMLEKVKLRFDAEGIDFAYHQVDITHRRAMDNLDMEMAMEMSMGRVTHKMKLAKGMKKIAEGWIVKPKGFRVRFEQMTDGELILGYSPPKEDNPLDSDVTTWRYGWKLAMATRPGDQGLEEGCLVNVTVVNDQDDPVNYYATGKPQIFNEYEKTI